MREMDGEVGTPFLSRVMMVVTVVELSDIRTYNPHSAMKLHPPD
jgi:hypothetical protein